MKFVCRENLESGATVQRQMEVARGGGGGGKKCVKFSQTERAAEAEGEESVFLPE